ncbi:S-adenosyl-L-methionine-dependent methyltransferase [Elsinoe ampelina]|uniref:NOL1/NOP2/Sun domain family member 4 n=1 Tax=Elsinoe ampelina TaxID=302913 RepID=A0A6A6G9X1_9PEZI|nr:S-adenosyl-L-methionine-dependent methyltransferase [Elsinoe ampelina]
MVNKTDRKRSDAAIEAFHKYYSSPTLWSSSRWDTTLFAALSRPVKYAMVINPFVKEFHPLDDLCPLDLPRPPPTTTPTNPITTPLHSRVFTHPPSSSDNPSPAPTTHLLPQPQPLPSTVSPSTPLSSHYNLDAASLLPVLLLSPHPGDRILDLCASPGGKSLLIGQTLFAPPSHPSHSDGALHSNEPHPARHARLVRNLEGYFPSNLLGEGKVRALKLDGAGGEFVSKAPVPMGGYDKVLLDAPCSSERHVVQSHVNAQRSGGVSADMLGFRTGTAGKKTIVRLQGELLMNALRVCRVGGRVVYSTCSIDRLENEGVVKGVMEKVGKGKSGFGVEVVEMDGVVEGLDEWSERCEVGRICLPDHGEGGGHGWGPIYFCVLTKVAA